MGTALAALVVLSAADLVTTYGRVWSAATGATAVLKGFDTVAADGSRRGNGDSIIRIGTLWADSLAHAELQLASKGGPRRLRVFANGRQVADVRLGELPSTVQFDARVSSVGKLEIELHGGRRDETVYRLTAVSVDQLGPRRVPGARVLQYLAFGGLLGYLAFAIVGSRWCSWLAALVLASTATLIVVTRLLALPQLGATIVALSCSSALHLASGWIERRSGMPVWASWPALLLCTMRVVAVCDLSFGSIDAEWHTHNMTAFSGGGQLIESNAPGVARSPYPPAFYAMLAPFRTHDYWMDVRLVRIGMTLLESAVPFLVFGIAVALGLSAAPAGAAALLAACMPEAVLVMRKALPRTFWVSSRRCYACSCSRSRVVIGLPERPPSHS